MRRCCKPKLRIVEEIGYQDTDLPEGVFGALVGLVLERVPVAVRELDQVHHRDPRHHQRYMVIVDRLPALSDKNIKPKGFGASKQRPREFGLLGQRIGLLINPGPRSTDHIEKNAALGPVPPEVGGEMLRPEQEVIEIVGLSIVFAVKEHKVHTGSFRRFFTKNVGQLEKDGDAACPIVRTENWPVPQTVRSFGRLAIGFLEKPLALESLAAADG